MCGACLALKADVFAFNKHQKNKKLSDSTAKIKTDRKDASTVLCFISKIECRGYIETKSDKKNMYNQNI